MSVKVASNRFIVSSITGFYQQLFQGASNLQQLGKRLAYLAESARVLRQIDQVEEAARILLNIPLREYQLIGQYYLSVCDYKRREGNPEKTQRVFEQVAEFSSSPNHRARAMLSLAAIAASKGDYTTELYYGLESLKVSSNLSIRLEALKGIAVIKAKYGDHRQALKEIQSLTPMLRYVNPIVCYDCLNSLAVELGEVGRIEEATNISNIVLASPLAFAYPQWHETGQDLALRGYKSRSSVPIIRKIPVVRRVPGNVLRMSEWERSEGHRRSPFDLPRDVSTIAGWKEKKMVKENGEENGEQNLDEMNEKDLFMELMRVASNESLTYEQLRKMVDAVKKIASKG